MYYFRALKDAEKAISLSSEWPKGHFRKGRALAGLKVSSKQLSKHNILMHGDPKFYDCNPCVCV